MQVFKGDGDNRLITNLSLSKFLAISNIILVAIFFIFISIISLIMGMDPERIEKREVYYYSGDTFIGSRVENVNVGGTGVLMGMLFLMIIPYFVINKIYNLIDVGNSMISDSIILNTFVKISEYTIYFIEGIIFINIIIGVSRMILTYLNTYGITKYFKYIIQSYLFIFVKAILFYILFLILYRYIYLFAIYVVAFVILIDKYFRKKFNLYSYARNILSDFNENIIVDKINKYIFLEMFIRLFLLYIMKIIIKLFMVVPYIIFSHYNDFKGWIYHFFCILVLIIVSLIFIDFIYFLFKTIILEVRRFLYFLGYDREKFIKFHNEIIDEFSIKYYLISVLIYVGIVIVVYKVVN